MLSNGLRVFDCAFSIGGEVSPAVPNMMGNHIEWAQIRINPISVCKIWNKSILKKEFLLKIGSLLLFSMYVRTHSDSFPIAHPLGSIYTMMCPSNSWLSMPASHRRDSIPNSDCPTLFGNIQHAASISRSAA